MSRLPVYRGDLKWVRPGDPALETRLVPGFLFLPVAERLPADDELALLIIVPHTTALRGGRWEFPVTLPFLRGGAFHLQQLQPVSLARLERKLGEMPSSHLAELRRAIAGLLRLLPQCRPGRVLFSTNPGGFIEQEDVVSQTTVF